MVGKKTEKQLIMIFVYDWKKVEVFWKKGEVFLGCSDSLGELEKYMLVCFVWIIKMVDSAAVYEINFISLFFISEIVLVGN